MRTVQCDNEYAFGSGAYKYSQYPSDWANLFVDITFPADGKVAGWNYYSLRHDITAYAAVYRPRGANKFELVGRNRLPEGRVGRVSYVVEEGYQISVKKGDFIGVHYDSVVNFGSNFFTVIPYAQGNV